MKRLHAVVSGEVQGVGFRAFVQRQAQSLGLTGWARNLSDGRVETLAEGEDACIDAFLDLLRKGPSMAQVRDVQMELLQAGSELSGFHIRSNASSSDPFTMI